jgi:adenylate cyclase
VFNIYEEWFTRDLFIKRKILDLQLESMKHQKRRAERLLLNIFPKSILIRMQAHESIHDRVPSASVLFADIVGFTAWSSSRTAEDIVSALNHLFSGWDSLCGTLGVEKIKTVGDAYFACCGVCDKFEDHSHRIAEMGLG